MQDRINFSPFEDSLKEEIAGLQAGLMDIEIKLQIALTESRKQFLS